LFHPGVAKEGLVPLIWFWAVGRQSGSFGYIGLLKERKIANALIENGTRALGRIVGFSAT
jgi:hypothetical protein